MKHSKRIFNYSVIFLTVMILSSFGISENNSKLSYRLTQKITLQDSEEKNLVWIFFRDKGPGVTDRISDPNSFLTKETIERRKKRIKSENFYDERDIPLYSPYLNELTSQGLQIKQKSKWFNAVSCYAENQHLRTLSEKDCISKIDLVQKFKRRKEVSDKNLNEEPGIFNRNQPDGVNELVYGNSYNQAFIFILRVV